MLPKKRISKKCEEYQIKILTKITLGRIEKKIAENLSEDQFDFWKNTDTREDIFCLRNYVEKSFKVNKNVYITFVDLLEAFDKVNVM